MSRSVLADEPPILHFESVAAWEVWLAEHHADQQGIWLAFAKKASGIPSVTYPEALDVALCWGWIDGQRKTHTGDLYIQRFTPRRPRSLWSKRNVAHVARLTESGRMRPPGLAEFEAARADGRLDAAYDAPSETVVPDEFLAAVAAHPVAQATFEGLKKAERYSIAWRLQTVKTTAGRARRFEAMLARLQSGEPPV